METFDKIWTFIEQKLSIKVPPYFKYVLKYCGFENGVSIAKIETADIQYFVSQVRNGSVRNHFKTFIGNKDVLEGSNKTEENFEFSLGHVKQLMYIVSFLRKHIEEYGRDSFSLVPSESTGVIKKRKHETPYASQKRRRQSSLNSNNGLHLDLQILEGVLLSQTIMSLTTYAPEIYVKYFRIINSKIAATNFIRVEIDKLSNARCAATICCPFCSRNHERRWNTSNFDDHLKVHQNDGSEENFVIEENKPEISGLLQNFVDSAKKNFPRKKPGYRHDDTIKMFAAFIKMIAGLLAYETLHANFPYSLPSVSTVNRYISDNGPHIIEGDTRTKELVEYLTSRNLPLKVCLAEDATRTTAKISFDPKTNQLVGFALPLDVNGMPIKLSFPDRNLNEIQKHFIDPANIMSSTAYVQMAQPVDESPPPFCLMIFLTDATFTAKNVLRRWRFQAASLREKGITIDNIATDGDSRTLMVMKCLSRIGIQNLTYLNCEWFSCGGHVETTFTQDLIHIITKLRNRLLLYSRIFPIGSKIISSSFLSYLIHNVSKDKHLLNPSDIEPKDRQNFLSAEKLCSDKVIQYLLDFVPDSEETALYLKAMNCILNAYLNIKIKSEERIYLMWYAVFFFRAWRSWLLNSEKIKTAPNKKAKSYYNLKDNFISSNCYTCIELNAHTLVKKALIGSLSEGDSSKSFFPNLYGSQTCESMFRQVRSLSSTFSTVVNCNMFDIIHRIKKIQLQSDIISNSNGELKFPRFEKKVETITNRSLEGDSHEFECLSREIAIAEIEKARESVICDFEKLGIDTSKLNFYCQVKPVVEEDLELSEADEMDSDSEDVRTNDFFDDVDLEPDEEIEEDLRVLGVTGDDLMLRDYQAVQSVHLDEKSPFVVVVDKKGKEMVVRKSSVCWLLSKDKFRLSSDRLQRVKEKQYTNNSESNTTISADNYCVNTEISIGEWCIFLENIDVENSNVVDSCLVSRMSTAKRSKIENTASHLHRWNQVVLLVYYVHHIHSILWVS